MMIGGTAIAIDVYYKTPFIPLCIGSDGRIFGLLASGITLLGVVVYGVCEFACGGLGLWLQGLLLLLFGRLLLLGVVVLLVFASLMVDDDEPVLMVSGAATAADDDDEEEEDSPASAVMGKDDDEDDATATVAPSWG